MNTLLIAIIIFIGIGFILLLFRGKGVSHEYSYQSETYLLSKAERSFYGVLVQAIGNRGLVFSKVRVADVITPQKGLNRSDWQRAFNAISSKHFDFLICNPDDCSFKLAIELDDSSHRTAKGKNRDALLNSACESAGLPLLRIKASKAYVVADILRQIEEAISPNQATVLGDTPIVTLKPEAPENVPFEDAAQPVSESPSEAIPSAVLVEAQESASPNCPRCGEPMILRQARTGSNAGQSFWGCSTFPKCRGVLKHNAMHSDISMSQSND